MFKILMMAGLLAHQAAHAMEAEDLMKSAEANVNPTDAYRQELHHMTDVYFDKILQDKAQVLQAQQELYFDVQDWTTELMAQRRKESQKK